MWKVAALLACIAAVVPGGARAVGGSYDIEGGTALQRTQVVRALTASSFDWDVVAARITVHLARGVDSRSEPGHVWLDTDLLSAGVFSWAIVQDEFAHQVDFLLFDDATRRQLTAALGARTWCHAGRPGLDHSQYGCERFASTLVWSFWQSKQNAYRPRGADDESAAMDPRQFRALVTGVVSERLGALGLVR
jgi:hypothetical protein